MDFQHNINKNRWDELICIAAAVTVIRQAQDELYDY
jgi:hypothetical protein